MNSPRGCRRRPPPHTPLPRAEQRRGASGVQLPCVPHPANLNHIQGRVCLPKRPQCCEKKLSPHRFPALTRSPDGTVPLLPAAPQLEPRQHLCGRCSGRNIDTCLLEASGVSWVASARRPEVAADSRRPHSPGGLEVRLPTHPLLRATRSPPRQRCTQLASGGGTALTRVSQLGNRTRLPACRPSASAARLCRALADQAPSSACRTELRGRALDTRATPRRVQESQTASEEEEAEGENQGRQALAGTAPSWAAPCVLGR